GGSRRAIIDLSQQRADRNGLAILGHDVAERARRRRRDFDRDLVGLELDQGLIDRDGIAGLLEPAADGGLGHGFTERRNANFSHRLFPLASWPGIVVCIFADCVYLSASGHPRLDRSKSKPCMPATSAGMTALANV